MLKGNTRGIMRNGRAMIMIARRKDIRRQREGGSGGMLAREEGDGKEWREKRRSNEGERGDVMVI